MRTLVRVAGVVVGVVVGGAVTAPPATAAPPPHTEEWWFSGWEIQNRVWPLAQGEGVTVAVIDSGVNASIPELSGVVLPGADFDTGGTDGRTDTDTGAGHGTGMAALIAAQGGPTGWVGVAPEARILPIVRGGSPEAEAQAIRYAVDEGAEVISMSFGAPGGDEFRNDCPRPVLEAVTYAVEHDVVLVAAAGNDGDSDNVAQTPASCPGVLAVGAIDGNSLNPWSKTQRQDYVAVAAPGAQVGSVGKDGRLYHDGAGTSQATALTAGVVALVRSELPDLSGREVVQRLINTTTDVGPRGVDDMTGHGLVLPFFAMTTEVDPNAPNPPYERLDQVLAQQPGLPGGGDPAVVATPPPGGSAGGGGLSDSIVGVVGLGGLALVAVLIVVLVRGRSRRRAGAQLGGPPPWPQPGQAPPYDPTTRR